MKTLDELQNTHDTDLNLLLAELVGTHKIERLVGAFNITDRNGHIKQVRRREDGILIEKTDSRFEEWADYANDLNACHNVTMGLPMAKLNGRDRVSYWSTLRRSVLNNPYGNEVIDATAHERTIALILTLQKP